MANFSNIYDTANPTGSSFARYGQEEIRRTRSGLQERLGLEHYPPGSSNQDDSASDADCRHKPGEVSAVLIATEAAIFATAPGGTGCLAFGEDTKILYIWNGSNWSTYSVGNNYLNLPTVDLSGLTWVNGPGLDVSASSNMFDGSDSTYEEWTSGSLGDYIRVDLGSSKLRNLFFMFSHLRNPSDGNAETAVNFCVTEDTNFNTDNFTSWRTWKYEAGYPRGSQSGLRSGTQDFYGRYLWINNRQIKPLRIYRLEVREL